LKPIDGSEHLVKLPDQTALEEKGRQIAVVIVSHDSSAPLATLLPKLTGSHAAIVVVDNKSRDQSVEVAERAGAQIVRMSKNAGYAAACNEGTRAVGSDAEWIGFVNPDVMLTADDLQRLTTEVPAEIWAVAPLTVTLDGRPQPDVARPAPTPWFVAAMYMGLTRSTPPVSDLTNRGAGRYYYTDVLSGGSVFVRRETLELIGGWDDAFFFNCEDIDLCVRIGKAGGRVAIDRDVRVAHDKAHSSAGVDEESRRLEGARAYATYFQIHGSRLQTALVVACIYTGCVLRQLVDRFRRSSPPRRGVTSRYGRLLRLLWTTVRQKYRHQPPTRPASAEFLDP